MKKYASTEKITPDLRAGWQSRLEEIGRSPLALCPDFPEVARRWEDWWYFRADRPLLIARTPKTQGIRWDKAFDLIDEPERWLSVRRAQVENTHCAGEAIPFVRVDIGPVSLAAYLGAPLHLSVEADTSWQDPIINDWEDLSWLAIDPGNEWFQRILGLLDRLAQDAAGRYAVCLPDLTGAIDALSNMRSPDQLCMDLFDNPERVVEAALLVVNAWETAFATMYATVLSHGAGVVQWLGCWAQGPHTVPTCDFTALIGPDVFRKVCLPSLAEQARRAGRCVFHLDGPEASRHAETLGQEPAITAIQYTPGAATPSAVAKLPMFRTFQEAGKPLLIYCPAAEIEQLAHELDPSGLVLWAHDVRTPQHADQLMETILRV